MPFNTESAGVKRLKRRREFLRVQGAARKWVAPGLIVQARRREDGDGEREPKSGFRVGLPISVKVGNAVRRNRARRRLRAVADRVMPGHAMPGQDYVLIARAETVNRPFVALAGDLEAALRGLGAYRNGDDGGSGLAGKEKGDPTG